MKDGGATKRRPEEEEEEQTVLWLYRICYFPDFADFISVTQPEAVFVTFLKISHVGLTNCKTSTDTLGGFI